MATRSRFVFFAVVGLVVLSGMVFAHGASWLAGQLGWADPAMLGLHQLPATKAGGYALAVLMGTALLRVPTLRGFADDVADELLRVSWPSREETTHATVVVVVCVIVSAAFLGLFDATWMLLSGWLLGTNTAT